MRRATSVLGFALALVLLAPSASAVWRGYATAEPDTSYDAADGYMFVDAPTSQTDRIYLSVIETLDGGPAPNSATLGTRAYAPADMSFMAMVGVWADCNHDGYIGMADGAMREYRAEASSLSGHAVDNAICPVVSETSPNAVQGTVHNDGNWITEMIPIGNAPVDTTPIDGQNARYLSDPDAKIWGDRGAPLPVAQQATCEGDYTGKDQAVLDIANAAFPSTSEAQHTGGILHHADCVDGEALGGTYNTLASSDPTGLLAGLPNPETLYADGGPLDVPTLGTDQSCRNGEPQPCTSGSNSIVAGEQDCSAAPLVPLDAVAPGSGVRPPGRISANPGGTVAATVNETHEESPGDDCNSADDRGGDVYGGVSANRPTKISAAVNFAFHPLSSRSTCLGASARVCGTPSDAGLPEIVGPARNSDTWTSNGYYQNVPRAASPHRDTRGNLAFDAFASSLWTFYANVNVITAAGPHVGASTYGAPWCVEGIGQGAPPQNSWNCDPAQWPGGAKVGDAYNLRDVDCDDNTLVGAGTSPTHAPLGPRTLPLLTEPSSACP